MIPGATTDLDKKLASALEGEVHRFLTTALEDFDSVAIAPHLRAGLWFVDHVRGEYRYVAYANVDFVPLSIPIGQGTIGRVIARHEQQGKPCLPYVVRSASEDPRGLATVRDRQLGQENAILFPLLQGDPPRVDFVLALFIGQKGILTDTHGAQFAPLAEVAVRNCALMYQKHTLDWVLAEMGKELRLEPSALRQETFTLLKEQVANNTDDQRISTPRFVWSAVLDADPTGNKPRLWTSVSAREFRRLRATAASEWAVPQQKTKEHDECRWCHGLRSYIVPLLDVDMAELGQMHVHLPESTATGADATWRNDLMPVAKLVAELRRAYGNVSAAKEAWETENNGVRARLEELLGCERWPWNAAVGISYLATREWADLKGANDAGLERAITLKALTDGPTFKIEPQVSGDNEVSVEITATTIKIDGAERGTMVWQARTEVMVTDQGRLEDHLRALRAMEATKLGAELAEQSAEFRWGTEDDARALIQRVARYEYTVVEHVAAIPVKVFGDPYFWVFVGSPEGAQREPQEQVMARLQARVRRIEVAAELAAMDRTTYDEMYRRDLAHRVKNPVLAAKNRLQALEAALARAGARVPTPEEGTRVDAQLRVLDRFLGDSGKSEHLDDLPQLLEHASTQAARHDTLKRSGSSVSQPRWSGGGAVLRRMRSTERAALARLLIDLIANALAHGECNIVLDGTSLIISNVVGPTAEATARGAAQRINEALSLDQHEPDLSGGTGVETIIAASRRLRVHVGCRVSDGRFIAKVDLERCLQPAGVEDEAQGRSHR